MGRLYVYVYINYFFIIKNKNIIFIYFCIAYGCMELY